MAGPLSIQIVGLEQLLAKLTPNLYRPALATLIQDATLLAQRTAREGAPSDTGALARSIMADAQPTSGRVYSTLAYAQVMEEGRRPGAKMPPPAALKGWMSRHGINPKLAFVLARAIGRRGIKGRFFMKAAVDAVGRAMDGLAARAAADVVRRFGS